MKKKKKNTTNVEEIDLEGLAEKMQRQIEGQMALLAKENGHGYVNLGLFCMKLAVTTAYKNAITYDMNPGRACAVTLALCAAADRISDRVCGIQNPIENN